jgi:hypothetical protein
MTQALYAHINNKRKKVHLDAGGSPVILATQEGKIRRISVPNLLYTLYQKYPK